MSKFKKMIVAVVPMIAVMVMAGSVAQAKGGVEDGGPSGKDKAKSSSSSSKKSSSSSNAKHTGTDSARDQVERGAGATHVSGFDSERDMMERGAGAQGVAGEDNPERMGDDNGTGQEAEVRHDGQDDGVTAGETENAIDDMNRGQVKNADFQEEKTADNQGMFERVSQAIMSFFSSIF